MSRKRKKQAGGIVPLAVLGVCFSTYFLGSAVMSVGIFIGVIFLGLMVKATAEKKRRERLQRSGIDDIDKMDGIQFEHYLKEVFLKQGYQVEVTRAAGDFGADLILKRSGQTIAVQAKRYSKPVGIKAVQEITGSLKHYGADAGWIVTNRSFTNQASELAKSNRIRLIGREELIELALQLNPLLIENAGPTTIQHNPMTDAILKKVEPATVNKKCRQCGGKMKVRRGQRGQFYGCENYPRCRNTESF